VVSEDGGDDEGVKHAVAGGSALVDIVSFRVDAADGQLAVRLNADLSRARKHIDNNHSFYCAGTQARKPAGTHETVRQQRLSAELAYPC
jgi:hypothetical protein